MWQCRALRAVLRCEGGKAVPADLIGMVTVSMLAHSYDTDALDVLLRVAFYPDYVAVGLPALTSAGKIAKTSHVMADAILRDGRRMKNQALFLNTTVMQAVFRGFADRLALTDDERRELFAVLRRWVVCDYRLDPAMDPADPDARRLTVH